jgi:Tol biopolymer transport system component
MTELASTRNLNGPITRASYHRVMRTLFAGVALATMLLASVAAAAPGAKLGGDAFPGRNGELVFAVTNRSRYYPDLYLVHSDGTGLRRITSRGAYTPAWSPDGKWIAFASNRSRPRHENASEIYVMRANGTALRRVTRNRFADFQPAWAPDGKRLVFQSSSASGSGIAVINVNGTGFRRLTDDGEAVPEWSPDGKTIAFALGTSRGGATATYGIWLMNPDGSGQRQLTFPPQHSDGGPLIGSDSMPSWSPDGEQIAFTRGYRGRTDIYVVRLDGTGLRRLTKQVGQHYSPTWSPNGRRIVFVTALYQRRVIDVMNADGTQQRRLITGRGGYIDPDWQPLPRS